MQSEGSVWFSPESKRAGWFSAGASIVAMFACLWLASVTSGSRAIPLLFGLSPLALGWVAVGALNFRRWHGLTESLKACFLAVLDVYKILGTLVALSLCLSLFSTLIYPPAFVYLVILLIYGFIYLIAYILASFVIAVAIAFAAGSVLYGLLWVMRSLGEMGGPDPRAKNDTPRPLRLVV